MVFRRKPKPPLTEAARLVQQSVALIHAYWRDRDYMPSATDLTMFRQLEDKLFLCHAAVRRIVIRMERRFHDEPEIDEHKWSRRG